MAEPTEKELVFPVGLTSAADKLMFAVGAKRKLKLEGIAQLHSFLAGNIDKAAYDAYVVTVEKPYGKAIDVAIRANSVDVDPTLVMIDWAKHMKAKVAGAEL